MKCTVNENNEITNFWVDDINAPKDSIVCDATYPVVGFEDAARVLNYCYKLNNGVVELSTAGLEYDAKQYQRNRAEAYPSTVDQLDDIYHNGVDGWKATIKAVKDTYPKETI